MSALVVIAGTFVLVLLLAVLTERTRSRAEEIEEIQAQERDYDQRMRQLYADGLERLKEAGWKVPEQTQEQSATVPTVAPLPRSDNA